MKRNLLYLAAALLWASLPVRATMTPRLTLEELVERSEVILHGRCLRSWPAWDAARQFIWTHHEIQVSDTLKGSSARTIVVSEPGGRVDGMELLIEGMPRYQPGEEMVLFLYRTPVGLWRARGLGQGQYAVLAGPDGTRRVKGDLHGVALVEPAGAAGRRGINLRQLDGISLDEFKSQVHGIASRQGKELK